MGWGGRTVGLGRDSMRRARSRAGAPGQGRGRRDGQGEELPEYPTFFDKPTTTVIGPHDEIPFDPNFSEKIDYEAELAVVIGRRLRGQHAGSCRPSVALHGQPPAGAAAAACLLLLLTQCFRRGAFA